MVDMKSVGIYISSQAGSKQGGGEWTPWPKGSKGWPVSVALLLVGESERK